MKGIFKDFFTEADGKSYDVTIGMGVGTLLIGWVLVCYSVFWLHKDFNIVDFAAASTAIIAGTGAGARLKPQAPLDDKAEQK